MVNWEFLSGDVPPAINRGRMKCFIVYVERSNGNHGVFPAYYLNEYPLDRENCTCVEEHDDGCPATGWFYDESNFDYEHCYYELADKVLGYAKIPDVETAKALLNGVPW